jgi:hypothetical protein
MIIDDDDDVNVFVKIDVIGFVLMGRRFSFFSTAM